MSPSRRSAATGDAVAVPSWHRLGRSVWPIDASPPHARREQLAAEIARLFATHRALTRRRGPRPICGPRAIRSAAKAVGAITREHGLVSRPKRRWRGTTKQGEGRWRAPDLVGSQFAATTLNRGYGDGTEIDTDKGKLYPDSVLDMAAPPEGDRVRDR